MTRCRLPNPGKQAEQATNGDRTGQLAEVTDGACPSFCPSTVVMTIGPVFDI